jgi:hypothetical protein
MAGVSVAAALALSLRPGKACRRRVETQAEGPVPLRQDVSRKLKFSLRFLFLCVLVISIALAATRLTFRWARRDIAEIRQLVKSGVPLVDSIEAYSRRHRGAPPTLEAGGITSPFTSRGYFAYESWDAGQYGLHVYLGPNDGYLRWDATSRCWTTDGRIPWEATWTEAEARRMAATPE